MIIGKDFFITEMPKTGTTFLRSYFSQYKSIELTIHHETINQNKKYDLLSFKNRIGVIRNPFEWYLSIWKSTCKDKDASPIYNDLTSIRLKIRRLKLNRRLFGYIFSQLTKKRVDLKILFKDVNSRKNFNTFIDIMLNFKFRNIIGSDYSFVPFEDLGYMTYIFFSQNVLRINYNTLYNSNYNLKKVLDFNDSKLYTNIFFKTESLTDNLKNFLENKDFELKSFKNLDNNSSSQISSQEEVKDFFSEENILLIEKKENYIFEKFNYNKLA